MKTSLIRKVINKGIDALGVTLPKPAKPGYKNQKMLDGLKKCRERGISVKTIVDVGAGTGSFTLLAQEVWPECSYLLFEPLEERRAAIETLVSNNANFHYSSLAAGKEAGTINFLVSEDLDGSGVAGNETLNAVHRLIKTTSISTEVKRFQLPGPYVIKLDTHGFEVPIIEGCSDLLSEVSLFIIEVYGFHLTQDSLLFWEMCQYMDQLGFRLVDIVDIMHRPKDNCFWQCDAFFIAKTAENFLDNDYN